MESLPASACLSQIRIFPVCLAMLPATLLNGEFVQIESGSHPSRQKTKDDALCILIRQSNNAVTRTKDEEEKLNFATAAERNPLA